MMIQRRKVWGEEAVEENGGDGDDNGDVENK